VSLSAEGVLNADTLKGLRGGKLGITSARLLTRPERELEEELMAGDHERGSSCSRTPGDVSGRRGA
jgi:hypothetical protein